MKQHIAVAISGGIDSLYAARLLIRQGHTVTGIHFVTGYGGFPARPIDKNGAVMAKGIDDETVVAAMSGISAQLGIPIYVMDVSAAFESSVVGYFVGQYQKGETPNPCLTCNPRIKFGLVLDYANSIGADALATGHYARTTVDETGRAHLFKGKDPVKDQSYFLAFLKQEALKKALFPLGGLTKSDITTQAAAEGLTPVCHKESQDVCFIPDDYKDFLQSRPGFRHEEGDIRTLDGKKVGVHPGLHSFTIGQRRGINCPAAFPYYVVRIDTATNTLYVGEKQALLSDRVHVTGLSWINEPKAFPLDATVRIRYSHHGVTATLSPDSADSLTAACHEPVMSVTKGQGAVFYHGDEVLGGGWIA